MARDVILNALKAGINRLRTKGGADPSSLYDLVNGWVTQDGSIQSRPGTQRKVVLPANTKGMMAFHGKLWVFSHQAAADPSALVHVAVLSHPTDATQPLQFIHFASPFMGYPYVAAEFGNGDVYHYWLQSSGGWKASTMYKAGDIVEPTTPNGLAYKATGGENPPAWQPGTKYTVGDTVQPTVYNGFKYTLTVAEGANPASGASEPAWIASEGAQVVEDVDNTPAPTVPTGGSSPGGDRYSNLPGYKQDQLGANK